MPTLLERNQELLRRINNPGGLNEQLRELFKAGKRQQLLQGVDVRGVPFQPLAASTMKHHEGSSTPLAPVGPMSKIIARYEVTITSEPTRLKIQAGWPGLDWVKHHIMGGRHLPRRDPGGFRQQDMADAMRLWRDWLFRG